MIELWRMENKISSKEYRVERRQRHRSRPCLDVDSSLTSFLWSARVKKIFSFHWRRKVRFVLHSLNWTLKESEVKKYSMKDDLSICEGDISCASKTSNTTAKHLSEFDRWTESSVNRTSRSLQQRTKRLGQTACHTCRSVLRVKRTSLKATICSSFSKSEIFSRIVNLSLSKEYGGATSWSSGQFADLMCSWRIPADTSMIDIRCAMSQRHCWCSLLDRLLGRFPDQCRAGSVHLRQDEYRVGTHHRQTSAATVLERWLILHSLPSIHIKWFID